jgi:hypothetical protein
MLEKYYSPSVTCGLVEDSSRISAVGKSEPELALACSKHARGLKYAKTMIWKREVLI